VAFSLSNHHPIERHNTVAWIFAMLALSSLLASAADKDAKVPVAIAVQDSAWSTTLFGTGIKTNDEYTDGNIFLTVPVWSTLGRDGTLGGSYLFVEPYTSVGTEGEVASSLGFSYRHLFSHEPTSALQKRGRASFFEEGWFAGGSLFVDMLDTQHDNKFWQLGVGAEIGTRYVELRGNYYIPLSSQKLAQRNETTQTFTSSSTTLKQTDSGSDPTASGNQIVQDVNLTTSAVTTTSTTTVHTVTEIFEKGMEGWDAEMSVLLPWVDQWMDVKLIGGYFSFDNQPFGPQEFGTGKVHGWKLGAEVRPVPAIVLSGYWYEDKRFTGADWTVGLQLQVPLDRTWKDAFKMRRRHLVEHLAEPVHRQNDAIKVGNTKEQNSTSNTSVARVTRVVSQTKRLVVLSDDVIFVNNGGAVGNGIQAGDDVTGDGTAERPKATIQAGADIAATNNLTSGRVWNVYTQHSATNYTEDVGITQSVNFISSATPLMGSGGKRFGSGLMPVLDGSFATCGCIPLSFVGITGYEIHGSGFAAIDMVNVQTLKIASNKISNTSGLGISVEMINGNTGTAEITGNVLTQSGPSMDGLSFIVDGVDSYLDATVTGNNITGSSGSGVSFQVFDEAVADLLLVGNNLIGNGSSGLSVNLNFGDLKATLANNHFDSNSGHGVNLYLDNVSLPDTESFLEFESVGDTFSSNLGDGLHIESYNESDLFPGTVSFARFENNGARPLEAITDTNAFIDLSVENSLILSINGAGVHGVAGDGSSGFPNLFLSFQNTTIDVSGTDAIGIQIESPLTGVAALGVYQSSVNANGLNAIGVQFLGSGVSCGCFPTLGAQIYDSVITATGFNSRGVDIVASNSSAVAVDISHSTISADEVAIFLFASNNALGSLGVADGSTITSGSRGVLVDDIDTANVSLGIFDSFIGTGNNSAIGLNEAAGATLEAFVAGNTIVMSGITGPASDAVDFEKNGEATNAIFEDNVITSVGRGIAIRHQEGADFGVSIEGNTILANDEGILLINTKALGVFEATIQANALSSIGGPSVAGTGINLQDIDVNPGPVTLENNSVTGFFFSLDSHGSVTGAIRVNGADIVLPATVP
jgi:hypothetical protein